MPQSSIGVTKCVLFLDVSGIVARDRIASVKACVSFQNYDIGLRRSFSHFAQYSTQHEWAVTQCTYLRPT